MKTYTASLAALAIVLSVVCTFISVHDHDADVATVFFIAGLCSVVCLIASIADTETKP